MDGSSKFFIEAIEKAKIVEQNALREEFLPDEIISYLCEESGSKISIIPDESYSVDTKVDYDTKVLGTQTATLKDISDFKNEI